MSGGRCLAPGCTSAKLVKAHLLPAGFARGLHRPGGHNVMVDDQGGRRAKNQNGWFDRGILCGECDRRLGLLDQRALNLARRSHPVMRPGQVIEIIDVDGDSLATFATSVVWRASVSTLEIASGVSLGGLERRAGEAAFALDGANPFPVIANRYVGTRQDPRDFQMIPMRRRFGDLNAYVLPIGGFQLIVLADGRERPPLPAAVTHLVVNSRTSIRCLGVPLETSTEYGAMLEAARAGRHRPAET